MCTPTGSCSTPVPPGAATVVDVALVTRDHRVTKTFREVAAPMVWPPPLTFAETRIVAEQELSGVRYRRHVQGRYSLTCFTPACATTDGRGAP